VTRLERTTFERDEILSPEARPLILTLLTLLALLLRLFQLGANSLWVDELITLHQGTVEGYSLWTQFLDDYQNPLPMVVFAIFHGFSASEAWLRIPSVLWGACSVPLLFVVGRRIVGTRAALFASLLLALHPMHVYFSQEVRGYAAMLFFGLAATAVALGAGDRLSLRRWVAFVCFGAACVLSNMTGLLWMAGLGLGIFVARRIQRRDLLRWFLAFAAMLLLTSHWWSGGARVHESERLLPGTEMGEPLRGETTFNFWALPYAGLALSNGAELGPSKPELHRAAEDGSAASALQDGHLPWLAAAAGIALILFLTGVRHLGGRNLELAAWVLFTVAAALALALRNVKPFNPRYLLAVLPVLLLVYGVALDRLPKRLALALLAGWIALGSLALYRHWYVADYMHEDVRSAVEIVEGRESNDDLILAPGINLVVRHYYSGDQPVINLPPVLLEDAAIVRTQLAGLPEEGRYLWYLRARPWQLDPRRNLLEGLQLRYGEVARFQASGVDVYLFDRSSGAEQEPDPGD